MDRAAAERTAAELGDAVVGLHLDVTDLPGFTAFLDDVERRLGPIDVLINNAGIMPITPLEAGVRGEHHPPDRDQPPRRHPRHAGGDAPDAPAPAPATSSTSPRWPERPATRAWRPTAATKHAVVGLSEAARFELKGSGVEVSCVMPGIVNTELASGMTEARGVKNLRPEQVADEIVAALKVPRFDVFVPRSTAGCCASRRVLPRNLRERLAHVMKADQVAVPGRPGEPPRLRGARAGQRAGGREGRGGPLSRLAVEEAAAAPSPRARP